ncbi:hypothetical protein [Pseudomonas protegens]|uniref:hypothetical protein n=1 Tax=Pseudomonas protegens TaxID=380021 RepID=UPI0011CEC591|nr:hypothetical protein [Pseudomonas protegens]
MAQPSLSNERSSIGSLISRAFQPIWQQLVQDSECARKADANPEGPFAGKPAPTRVRKAKHKSCTTFCIYMEQSTGFLRTSHSPA